MVSRIIFKSTILRGQEEDDKAAELGFQKANRRFKPGNRVEVLDIMSKDRIENEFHKYSVAHIYSGIVTDENDLVEDKGKSCYTYRVHLDNGWVMCNVYPVRMRKIT